MKPTLINALRAPGTASGMIRLIVLCLLCQLFISLPVWVPAFRDFPLVAAFPALTFRLGSAIGLLVFGGMCLSLVALAISPRMQWPVAVFLPCAVVLVLEDVTRFQPWVFLFSLLLAGKLVFSVAKLDSRLRFLAGIILSGTYFWSGVLKLNHAFSVEMFPWLMEFAGLTPFFDAHPHFAYVAGVLEALAGLLWWLPKGRKWAVLLALGTHSFIFLSFGPFGHNWNTVVLPWNAVFALLYIALYLHQTETPAWWRMKPKFSYATLVAVFVMLLPALNLFGWWDHFPSGSFYSSNVPEGIFYYHESDRATLPRSSAGFQLFTPGTHEEFLMLDHWALDNLAVPMYPESRNHIAVGRQLCACVNSPDSAGIRIAVKAQFSSEQQVVTYSCAELLAN